MKKSSARALSSILIVTLLKGFGSLLSLVIAIGIANLFGAGLATDSYFFARRVTSNFAMALERAFHLLQVPPLVAYARQRGLQALRKRLLSASGRLFVLAFIVSAVAVMFADPIVSLLAPGIKKREEAVLFFRILLVGLPISAVTALTGATMNALRSFSLPTAARLAPRIAVVLALLLVPFGFGIGALAVAVVVGTAVMGLAFAFGLRRVFAATDELPQPVEHTGYVQGYSRQRLLAMLVAQAHILCASWIDLGFASLAGEGSIAIYDFGQRLVNMTPGLVTNSVVLVYYTEFANALAEKRTEVFKTLVRDSLRLSLFFVLPISAVLPFIAQPLVSALLERGRFSAEDAHHTATIVAALAFLLPVNAALGTLVSAIFADPSLPQLRMIVMSAALAIAVRVGFDLWAVPRFGVAGVPIGSVLAMTALFIALYIWLSRQFGAVVRRSEGRQFIGLALSTAVAAFVAWAGTGLILPEDSGVIAALVAIAAIATLSGSAFMAVATVFDLPETRAVLRRLARLRQDKKDKEPPQ